VRGSFQDIEDGADSLNALRALIGLAFGKQGFDNKYRLFFRKSTDEFCVQRNTGTEAVPVWEDVWCIRFSDGQLQVTSEGGLQSNAGFYGPLPHDLLTIGEIGSQGNTQFTLPNELFFNTDLGFYLTSIKGGSNQGKPVVNFAFPFGRSKTFEQTGRTWQVNHNFGVSPVLVQTMTDGDVIVIPDKVDVSNPNTAFFYFHEVTSGKALIATGGTGAVELRPVDPFYLAVRSSGQSAEGRVLRPNAELIFDKNHFYVDVNLDLPSGTRPRANVSFIPQSDVEITFKDTVSSFQSPELNFNRDDFYLTPSKTSGRPVVNATGTSGGGGGVTDHGALTGLNDEGDHPWAALVDGTRDITGHQRFDDSINVENTVTAEAFYLTPGSGGEFSKSGDDVRVGSTDGNVIVDPAETGSLEVLAPGHFEGTVRSDEHFTGEAFYVSSGGELSASGNNLQLAASGSNEVVIPSKVRLTPPEASFNTLTEGGIVIDPSFSTVNSTPSLVRADPTVTVSSVVFAFSVLKTSGTYTQEASPAFAAFSCFSSSGTTVKTTNNSFQPMAVIDFVAGSRTQNDGAGALGSSVLYNKSFVANPTIDCTTSGDTLTVAETTGLEVEPSFDVVSGATVDMGTIRGVFVKDPTVTAGGSAAGTEQATAYIGVDVEDITTLTYSGDRVAFRSALAAGADNYFLRNTGGAQSNLGGGS
jgi:hypothetical protein